MKLTFICVFLFGSFAYGQKKEPKQEPPRKIIIVHVPYNITTSRLRMDSIGCDTLYVKESRIHYKKRIDSLKPKNIHKNHKEHAKRKL